MNSIELRSYQKTCISKIKDSYSQGKKRLLISLPTGSGKTVIFGSLIAEMGIKTLILTHTEELLFQTAHKMQLFNPEKTIGLFYAKAKEFKNDILVSTIQSACTEKALEVLTKQKFEMVIVDECHHSAAQTWRRVLNRINPKLLVGFTATAFRSDKKGLAEIYEEITYEKSIVSMINTGYLSPIVSKQIRSDLDFSAFNEKYKHKSRLEDFSEEDLETQMNTAEMIENTVDTFAEEAADRKAIVFCTSVNHAENMAEAFIHKGFSSQFIYGGMNTETRQKILKDFTNNKIQILTNCQILTEGFDEPSINAVVVCKPTKSPAAFQQMIGRGLRLYPNKTNCLVLDFTDKDRTIFSVSKLLHDSNETIKSTFDENNSKERERKLLENLPKNLNKKLKTFLVNINLFPNDFTWKKENENMILNGINYDIKILKKKNGFFRVFSTAQEKWRYFCEEDLDFEMAYGIAEQKAKKDSYNFILTNRNAPWRKDTISEKQENVLRKFKYKNGISELTKGDANDIIGQYLKF